jgi:hypothetical protein
MKIKTTVHVHYNKYSWETKGCFEVFSCKVDDSEFRTYVGPQEVEVEVPENYDPRAQQIAALEAKKQKIMADFQKSVTDINRRISELSAVEYTA